MQGMSNTTGKALGGMEHLRQSIADILSTPIGTRVMRRDYGSLLFELSDQPFTGALAVRLYASIAEALMRWEPRLRLSQLSLRAGARTGAFMLTLSGMRVDGAQPSAFEQLTIPLQTAA